MNLPMDEVLCNVTLDISGRPYLVFNCDFNRENIGTMSCEMVEEFFRALAFHLVLHYISMSSTGRMIIIK